VSANGLQAKFAGGPTYSIHCSQGFYERETAHPYDADPRIVHVDSHPLTHRFVSEPSVAGRLSLQTRAKVSHEKARALWHRTDYEGCEIYLAIGRIVRCLPTASTWFSMGSTYSYLSVMRLVELERSSGIPFRWRPFHLLIILDEMKHIPFADKPKKSAYMWRDIERRAAMYSLVARLPAPYPAKQSIIANLVALVGMREGWGVDFVRAAYRRWLQLGQEPGSEPNVFG
jgi:hypothetical protein